MEIGVLALQGDFAEHLHVLQCLGVTGREVRLPDHVAGLDGLVIPGGESTTIGKLASDYELMEPLRQFGQKKAIWGTCAGAIFLSNDVRLQQPLLGLMDIKIARNAFGRQVDSFEVELDVQALEIVDPTPKPFHAVFIRAPLIETVGESAETLAQLSSGEIVSAQQGNLLVTSFHPELTPDDRFHRYFLHLVQNSV